MPLIAKSIETLSSTDVLTLSDLPLAAKQTEFAGSFQESVAAALSGDPGVIGYALLEQGKPVGIFLLKRPPAAPDWAPENTVTLHALKITTTQQGRGLGLRAMNAVIEMVRKMPPPTTTLMLCVDADNAAAVALYERAGMTKIGAPQRGRVGLEHRFALTLR